MLITKLVRNKCLETTLRALFLAHFTAECIALRLRRINNRWFQMSYFNDISRMIVALLCRFC